MSTTRQGIARKLTEETIKVAASCGNVSVTPTMQDKATHNEHWIRCGIEQVILGERGQQGHKQHRCNNHSARHGYEHGPVLSRSRLGRGLGRLSGRLGRLLSGFTEPDVGLELLNHGHWRPGGFLGFRGRRRVEECTEDNQSEGNYEGSISQPN